MHDLIQQVLSGALGIGVGCVVVWVFLTFIL